MCPVSAQEHRFITAIVVTSLDYIHVYMHLPARATQRAPSMALQTTRTGTFVQSQNLNTKISTSNRESCNSALVQAGTFPIVHVAFDSLLISPVSNISEATGCVATCQAASSSSTSLVVGHMCLCLTTSARPSALSEQVMTRRPSSGRIQISY